MNTTATGYGYYEARIKSAADNIVSGFWLDDPRTDSNPSDPNFNWEEIDIVCQRGTVESNNAVFSAHSAVGSVAGTDPYRDYATTKNLTSGYNVYGLSWTPTTLTWYFNGVACLQAPNTYWHDPQFVMFDLEADPIYEGAMPNTSLLPASMSVDYFRYWTEAPEPSPWVLLATGALGVAAYVWSVRRRILARPA
jgi:beta-glucanase (GH16 family)